MRRLLITGSAIEDLDGIWAYLAIEQHSPTAADRLIDEVDIQLRLLVSHPLSGEAVEHLRPKTRRIVIRNRYLVFYEPQDEVILVLRVLHGARLIEPCDLDR